MNCEVCGAAPTTAHLHTPKGRFDLCWSCETVAEMLINKAGKADRWSLSHVGAPAEAS